MLSQLIALSIVYYCNSTVIESAAVSLCFIFCFLLSLLYRHFPNICISLKPKFMPKEYTFHALSA